jgi:hypothetical protein
MTKRLAFILLVMVTLTMILTACKLPASKAPAGTPTLAEDFPFPVVTTQPNVIQDIQTQTAVAEAAASPKAPEVVATETATPDNQAGGGAPAVAKEVSTDTPAAASTSVPSSHSAVPTVTRPSVYALQKGEWPICIARRFDVYLPTFFSANGLTMSSKLFVGARLTIPSTGTWNSGPRALKSHPTTYTVRSGDTIYTVACSYGDVSPEAIIAVNSLSSPYTLTSGQSLQIP